MPSFDFRLLMRVLGRFSMLSLTAGLTSLPLGSEGEVMAWVSSFGELGAFEEDCLRWWMCAGDRFCGPVMRVWDCLESAEHDKHVQVLRRTNSLE